MEEETQILCDLEALSSIRKQLLGMDFNDEPSFKAKNTRNLL